MSNQPLRFGIIGTARIARRIVADMQSVDAIKVVGIASRDAARARWYADQYGIPQAFDGYDDLLACDAIDAVYIPLPPSMHVDWAIRAAQAGKHVLVEKPVATDGAGPNEIDAACKQQGVRWLDATAWMHHSRTKRMREIIESGELGIVKHISSVCSFFEPFQTDDHRLAKDLGGGCLLDLGWYALGMIRWAAGEVPTSVTAIGQQEQDVWYRCSAMLQFPSGITATTNFAYDTATRKWFEVAGDQASIVCDDFTRPWAGKPARFWIHDRAGNVKSEEFDGNQEVEMLKVFASEATLDELNRQAIDTQGMCQSVEEAIGKITGEGS